MGAFTVTKGNFAGTLTADDPSLAAPVYANLVECNDGWEPM